MADLGDAVRSISLMLKYWMDNADQHTALAWRRNERVAQWGRVGRGQQARQFERLAARLDRSLKDAEASLSDPPTPRGSLLPPFIRLCVASAQGIIADATDSTSVNDAMVLLQSAHVQCGAPRELGLWAAKKSEFSFAEDCLVKILIARLRRAADTPEIERAEGLVQHALRKMRGEADPEEIKDATSSNSSRKAPRDSISTQGTDEGILPQPRWENAFALLSRYGE